MAGSAHALTVSSTTNSLINDNAVIDGTRSDAQSSYSKEFAISSDTASFNGTTYKFGSIALSDVAVVGGQFQFVFDSQETGGSPTISIDDIVLAVGGIEIWNYDQATYGSLDLDGSTDSPLGNGADMGLYIDVTEFGGLTGADVLEFYWLQSDENNGPDEWVIVGDGYYAPTDTIPSAVPLPAPVLMLGAGLGLLGAARRRRKAA